MAQRVRSELQRIFAHAYTSLTGGPNSRKLLLRGKRKPIMILSAEQPLFNLGGVQSCDYLSSKIMPNSGNCLRRA